jgi:hypothetical protein
VTEQPDRRATERFAVNADASCPMISPVVEDFGSVKVRDVSMHGIGLLVSRRIEVGALIVVVLVNQVRGFNKAALVRVAHVTAITGGYLVGGSFVTPLTYQEMSALVL